MNYMTDIDFICDDSWLVVFKIFRGNEFWTLIRATIWWDIRVGDIDILIGMFTCFLDLLLLLFVVIVIIGSLFHLIYVTLIVSRGLQIWKHCNTLLHDFFCVTFIGGRLQQFLAFSNNQRRWWKYWKIILSSFENGRKF